MIQFFENIWTLLTSIFDFIVLAFKSLSDALVFCYNIFNQGILYIGAFGPTVLSLIVVIMTLFVIWLVLRVIHG